MIPRNIFQAWHTSDIPPKMRQTINKLKHDNPEFNHFLFNSDQCKDFIIKNFTVDVYMAFENLIPHAYKIDLWRLCVLYIHGGVYLDVKYSCINFKFIELINKEYFVLDRPGHWIDGAFGIYNALIVSKPKNPFLKSCIDRIVYHTRINFYGHNPLYPTGPGLLGIFYPQYYPKLPELKIETNPTQIHWNGRLILQQYPEYRQEQRNQNFMYYSYLWYLGQIYRHV